MRRDKLTFGLLMLSGFTLLAMIPQKNSAEDITFIKQAAGGQQFEINLGKLAATKGTDAFTKGFGNMMVHDHGSALSNLYALAKKKNIQLKPELSKDQKDSYDKLAGLKGAEFDKQYRLVMLGAHEKNLATFRKQSTEATDADVRSFAKKCVPVIAKHLKALQTKTLPKHTM